MKMGAILAAFLVLILLWFWHRQTATNTMVQSANLILPSDAHLTYIVPMPDTAPISTQHLTDYNWAGESDCGGCSSSAEHHIALLQDIHTVPGTSAGYVYIDTNIAYDPSLKGAANLARTPAPPIYSQYNAPGALFWWGWADKKDLTYTPGSVAAGGMGEVNWKVIIPATPVPLGTRVIFTNMGGVLPTGLFAPWSRDDGGSIISPITAIMFLGTHYDLDPSRSVGL